MTPLNHFDIRLTPQELDQIANLLAQQPWHQVNALLGNIKAQVDYQQKAAQEPLTGPRGNEQFTPAGGVPLSNGHDVAQ